MKDEMKGMSKKDKMAYAKGEIAEKKAELKQYQKMLAKKPKKNATKKR